MVRGQYAHLLILVLTGDVWLAAAIIRNGRARTKAFAGAGLPASLLKIILLIIDAVSRRLMANIKE